MAGYGYEELSDLPTGSVHHCIPLSQPGKQIRVLDLLPVNSSTPATTSALHGSLRVISVPTDREYSALSYVWAQEDPGTSERANRLVIHCLDHQHEARLAPNCWSALWHVSKTRKPLGIWVDSICIDQRNDGEKAQQLPLMGSIYTSASVTYFWLGEAGRATDSAMNFLSMSPLLARGSGISGVVKATAIILLRVLTFQNRPHQSGLVDIFNRPWITRLWTLQECLLSPNGIVMCGKKSIHFADFACALQSLHFFHAHPWSVYFDESHIPWLNLANLARWWVSDNKNNVWDLDQAQKWDMVISKWQEKKTQGQLQRLKSAQMAFLITCYTYGTISIWSILILLAIKPWKSYPKLLGWLALGFLGRIPQLYASSTSNSGGLTQFLPMSQHSIVEELRNRKALEPKDMYYGMMGILGDESREAAESLSVEALYRRLCTRLIQKSQSLDILLLANNHTNHMKNSPSWVIDWRSTKPRVWSKALYYVEPVGSKRLFVRELSDNTPLTNMEGIVGTVLDMASVRGLTKYQGAMPGTQTLWEFRGMGQELCIHGIWLTSVSSHFVPRQADLMGTGSPALKSLLHNALSDMTRYQQQYVIHFISTLRMRTNRSVKDVLVGLWLTLRLDPNMTQELEWLGKMLSNDNPEGFQELLDLILQILWKEELSAVCCKSSALCAGGLAFAGTAVIDGDAVVLVSGMSFPLVLRPCGPQRFKLVGPILLPGVMNGELQESVKMIPLDEMILV